MKKFLNKLCIITIILSMILVYKPVYAASTSYVNISASAKEINIGDTVTVTINVFSGSWGLNINGGGLETIGDATGIAGQTSTQGNATSSKSYTFKANSSGTFTISVNGDVTDYDTDENITINKSVSITVAEPVQNEPEQTPEQPTEPEQPAEPEQPSQPEENNPTDEPENNNTNTTPQEPEQTFTETNKIMYVKSDCSSLNLRKGPNTTYTSIGSLKSDEKITVIAIGSKGWYKVKTENGVEGYVAGNYLTDTEPEKKNESSTTTLSDIKVTPGKLNETFSKNSLSYTMTVEADVETIEVTATPTDSNAKVTVTGNVGLKTGTDNEISIKVVAEDGISTKTYKIKVTKLATEDEEPNIIEEPRLGLSTLSIEGIKINPEFKTTVYEYTVEVTDKTIEKLIINAIATFEDSKIEITGADEIKIGENVVTIIVTSANGEETVTYQIIVNKKEETVIAKIEPKEKEDSLQNIIIALFAAIAIVALILIFILIKRKEKAKPTPFYEDGDYNEPDENYNTYSNVENENTENIETYEEDDEDDDWGVPKKGIRSKFKKTGRHF